MKKGMKRTLLAFMVMAMLASSAAVPAMALAVPDGEGVVGQVLGATHSNGDEGVQPQADYVAQIGSEQYETFDAAFTAAKEAQQPVTIELLGDTSVASSSEPDAKGALSVSNTKNITVNLGTHTLTVTGDKTSYISEGASVTFTNGTLNYQMPESSQSGFLVEADSSISLQSVHMTCKGTALYAKGSAAAVNVYDSVIEGGAYAVGTNAEKSDNYYVAITLQNSTLSNSIEGGCAVMINVPGTLNVENCEIHGTRQGVIVRSGTAQITDSTITCSGDASDNGEYLNGYWSSGTSLPVGALIVGNRQNSTAYKDADCTVTNSTINYTGANIYGHGVYVYGNGTVGGETYYANLTMNNTRVTGNVSTNNESTTDLNDVTINGNLTADDQTTLSMDGGTTVNGSIPTGDNITKTYTVSFEGIGEEEHKLQDKVTIPSAPSISGASGFIGWSDGNRIWLPGETYTVKGNVTFKALFETVSEEETYIPSTPISDGWHHYSSGSMYYQDGKRTRGWADIDGAAYYFDEKGYMAAGWLELEDGWYYFAEDGKMETGWLKLGNTWYYLDPETGRMYDNGLATIGKYTYYFYDWGGMANTWWYEDENGGWYFFGGDGAMKAAQWVEWKGEWYYLTESGKMAVSTDIGGYTVNADGVWVG